MQLPNDYLGGSASPFSVGVVCVFPEALYMIEGMAQGALGSNWGDGHVTDVGLLNRVSSNADPNPFYRQLVNAPYANNAIISAHVYPCVSPPTCCVRAIR